MHPRCNSDRPRSINAQPASHSSIALGPGSETRRRSGQPQLRSGGTVRVAEGRARDPGRVLQATAVPGASVQRSARAGTAPGVRPQVPTPRALCKSWRCRAGPFSALRGRARLPVSDRLCRLPRANSEPRSLSEASALRRSALSLFPRASIAPAPGYTLASLRPRG